MKEDTFLERMVEKLELPFSIIDKRCLKRIKKFKTIKEAKKRCVIYKIISWVSFILMYTYRHFVNFPNEYSKVEI
jgi:hypothetical protein